MRSASARRLELTWYGKDRALIPTAEGKYDYTWIDRDDPRAREVRVLEPVAQHGVDADDNLLIVGDSADALRSLTTVPEWADRYLGKVRLIYIDPPFNTDQTFERYQDSLEHSIWLTMLRDRIRLALPLLAPDGSIWVHLDDAEVHRARSILDEELGADRFITQVIWQKRTSRENRAAFSESHDTILVYAPLRKTAWRHVRNRLPRTDNASNPDHDLRGPWTSVPFTAQGKRVNQMYKITTPTGVVWDPPKGRCWGATETEYLKLLDDNRIYFPKKGNGKPRVKQLESEAKGLVPHTIWSAAEVGDNDRAKKEILALFPDIDAFDTPKPEALLARIIEIATNPGDIVVDF